MSLLDESAEEKVSWKPKEAKDGIAGTVTNISSRDNGWGDYKCYTLRVSDACIQKELIGKSVYVHAFHTALANKLEDENVSIGDELAVTYQGLKDGAKDKNGKTQQYENYTTAVVKANPQVVEAPQWDSIPDSPEQTAAVDKLKRTFEGVKDITASELDNYEEPF